MTDGPVKIAEYGDEILAVNAQQMLTDNGIVARVMESGIVLQIPRYELHVKASQVAEAKELLAEFEAAGPDHDDEEDQNDEGDVE
jgi:hypothetical protein